MREKKASNMGDKKRRPVLPPVYFLGAILLMILIHFLAPRLRVIAAPLNLIGLASIVCGLFLGVTGNSMFKRHGTTIKPFEESSTLVTTGVFRFSRNPMYLGIVLILIGLGVVLGTAAPFIVLPVFVWLIVTRFIIKEEAMLEAQFGDAYRDYKRHVRRWL